MPSPRIALRAPLLAGAALLAAGAPAATAAPVTAARPAAAAALRPVGTPLRVVLLPVRLRGEPRATRAGLRRLLRGTAAALGAASGGRILLRGVVAPPIAAGSNETSRGILDAAIFRTGVRRAVARGVRFGGAVPVFVAPSRRPERSMGGTAQVLVQGSTWRQPSTLVHELGHALGLDHAVSPSACPAPFSVLACLARPRAVDEYGDLFDVMGHGADRFGAYSLAVLGLAAVTDAPPDRSVTTLRPADRRDPTLLRLRTADHDWLVESRARVTVRYARPLAAPAGVEITRVRPVYAVTGDDELFPKPVRVPAADPAGACPDDPGCLARQVFAPGRTLTVPGAFRLRVLGGRGGGRARVAATWLDRTPPAVAVEGATIRRPAGGAAELALAIRAAAEGAGVLTVEVDQGAGPVRIPADVVTGLASRGAGVVRLPLGDGATAARVTLIDAAGNRSAPADADLAAAPSLPGATIAFDPPLGAHRAVATPLPPGTAITVSGTTDPALAGQAGRLQITGAAGSEEVVVPIGPGGAFSATWAPPEPGLHRVAATIPVSREPNGIDLRGESAQGWVRG